MKKGDKVTIAPNSPWAKWMPEHVGENPMTVTAIEERPRGTYVSVVFEEYDRKVSVTVTGHDLEPWEDLHD